MWFLNLCWILTSLGSVPLINSAFIRFYRGSLDNYDVEPLATAESLLDCPWYNSSLANVMYTFGFGGEAEDESTTAVLNALFSCNDRNVFLLDWQREARSIETMGNHVKSLSYFVIAIPNAIAVSLSLGEALLRMSEHGLHLSRTHLIAPSLGAQIFGKAGRYIIGKGKMLDRITGLDPARPFFEQPSFMPPLGSDCAGFVDTIHTFPGGYGLKFSYATVDIYVNHGLFYQNTKLHVQPGCQYLMILDAVLCSHNRAVDLLIEALSMPHTLQASKAYDYYEWAASDGNSADIICIGDDIDRNARGNYYLTTNSQSPYGKGPDGLHPQRDEKD